MQLSDRTELVQIFLVLREKEKNKKGVFFKLTGGSALHELREDCICVVEVIEMVAGKLPTSRRRYTSDSPREKVDAGMSVARKLVAEEGGSISHGTWQTSWRGNPQQ